MLVEPEPSVTVERRYSHFSQLYHDIVARYPALVIPQPPAKNYAGRFRADFVEARRRDLERWCCRIVRHPVLRETPEIRAFFSTPDEPRALATSPGSAAPHDASWLDTVYHPEFNVDAAEVEDLVERYERHVHTVELGGGLKEVESHVGRVREAYRGAPVSTRRCLSHPH